jgi:predicted nuclease of predicted toxin-antitoxin system
LRILVDENVPKKTVSVLRGLGHDVVDIRGTEREGIPDSAVWSLANEQKRLLITTDKWFANNWTSPHNGILIVLLKHPNLQRIHERVLLALERFHESQWSGLIVVMRDTVQSVRKVH